MPSNKILKVAPQYIASAAANLLNCGITSLAGPTGYTQTQPYIIVKFMRAMNNDVSAHVVTLYIGATGGSAGGTEFAFDHISIPAQSYYDWVGQQRLDSTDYLTGSADASSKVTLNISAEIGLS